MSEPVDWLALLEVADQADEIVLSGPAVEPGYDRADSDLRRGREERRVAREAGRRDWRG